MIRGKKDKYEDKEGNVTGWSVLLNLLKNIGSSFAGMIPFGDTVWQAVDSVAFGGKFYGLENVSISTVNDAITALLSISSAFGKGINHFRLKAESALSIISKTIFGAPYDNVIRLFNLAIKAGAQGVAGEYYGNYIYLCFTEDPTVSGDKAKFYDNLYAAYKSGDYAQYVKLYDAMVGDDSLYDMIVGEDVFTEKSIKSAMENRMKADYGVKSVKDLPKRYEAPEHR